ncbi:MAG TPA: tetratricopeptide repeat protein [Desulfatiglandales bacterium]|nr:tetratricopeptide repeat protein [Desulfatiglandales bacterium]
MSYINEALKKAQKEKDSGFLKYGRLLAVNGKDKKVFRGKTILLGSLGIVLIFLAFTLYSWLDFKGSNTVAVPEPQKPVENAGSRAVENKQDLYERARRLQKIGRLREAGRLYQKALILDPNYVYALNNLGVVNLREGKYVKAQQNLEHAIRLKPDYVDPYYNLACLHALKGKTAESLTHLNKAVSLDNSVRQWAKKDPDLRNMEGLPEFEEIIRTTK